MTQGGSRPVDAVPGAAGDQSDPTLTQRAKDLGPGGLRRKAGDWWDIPEWRRNLQPVWGYHHKQIQHLVRQCRDFRLEVRRFQKVI